MRLAGGRVVAGPNQAAERGLQAEDREVAARHHQAFVVEGLAVVREVRGEQTMGGKTSEHRLGPLQIPEHRVADDVVAVVAGAGLIARLRARLWTRSEQVDQPVRFGHRKRPEEQLIEQGKDCGVGPDSERERRDRDARDERGLEEHAESEPQVGHTPVRRKLACPSSPGGSAIIAAP